MRFPIFLPGFEAQRIDLEITLWSWRILVNDAPAPRDPVLRSYLLTSDTGQEVRAQLIPKFDDIVPEVVVGGKAVRVVRPFVWFEYLCAFLPVILLFGGGAIGGGLGGAAVVTNLFVLRNPKLGATRYAICIGTLLLACAAYVIIAGALNRLFHR